MDTLSDRRRFVGLFSRSPASCAKARACGPGLRLDGSEPDTVLGSAGSRAVSPVWTRRRRRFFRGSTIAINALATKDAHFGAFGASSSVLELGLSEKDVSLISMGTDTERLSAMTQGVADATVVTIGGYVAAQKLGFHSLLDLSQANVPYEAASMITTRTRIKENPEMVGKFVKGFVAAIQYAQTHREVTLKVLSKYMRTADQEILNASYDYYVGRVIPRTPYVSEKGLQAVIDFVRQRNPQTPNVKAQDFMDNRFIKELDESGFIKSLYAK